MKEMKMLIFDHVTGDDIIDFDPATGLWRYPEKPRVTPELEIMARFTLPVRGSFTEVDGKRYYLYWTADRILLFRLPDGTEYTLFRHLSDARFEDLRDGLKFEIVPAERRDGSAIPGYSTVRMHDKTGTLLHEVSYFSQRYLQLYMMDITPFTDRDLGTWDFFVALKDAVEKISKKCSSEQNESPLASRIRARTGERCPLDGFWLVADSVDYRIEAKQGELMPSSQGRNVNWEWISRELIPAALFTD
ncbi:hypothetical protein GWL_34200 [Herbaspirillum sp. GW103]|uniref:hypothetical protein n=1 Tax=Herbaspirillum sp. GW103 TaxID=1175306 RepID=UPI00025E508C|nr:hypothetical protein [Herbaspirillum sp. GW103]EIJ46392.1 hypothetical protein GWL_34200 [Herbaspirillum sp. GW103]